MTTIGRYQLISPLGAGGMADVYLARDPALGREVAVKMPRLRPEALARFAVEARAVARLEHPAIVPIYEYGDSGGHPFLVMRHMRGGSLADRLRRGTWSLAQAVPLIERIAAALDYAHSQGVIHRDVKPGNILFDEHGQAFLSDFGIARLADGTGGAAGPRLTAVGAVPGSPAYLSPEQARGVRDLDGRSDIYALGVVLFEMLTGAVPHPLGPVGDVASLAAGRPDLPAAAQSVLARALAPDRNARYGRAADMAADLRRVAGGARPAAAGTMWLWVVGALALALGAGLLFAMTRDNRPTVTRPTPPQSGVVAEGSPPTDTPGPTATVAEQPAVDEVAVEEQSVPNTAANGQPAPFVIGHSARGAPIEAFRFGDGSQKLVFVGGLSAGYAPSTVDLTRAAIDHFTAQPEAVPPELSVTFIPVVSPDTPADPGEHPGRLNGNGVDVNRNWGCEWTADPLWDGVGRPGSGGPAPFSEPETVALRDFILAESPAAVVIWYARASGGLVSPGGCGLVSLVSDAAAAAYGRRSGYRVQNFGDLPGTVVNGDATNWLDSVGIPAVSVLLPSLITTDWNNNLNGILAVMSEYAALPPATPVNPEIILAGVPTFDDSLPAVPAEVVTFDTSDCDPEPAGRWADSLWATYRDRLGCPAAVESQPEAAFQYYQRGTMIWREDLDRIYVLYGDGTFSTHRDDEGPVGYYESPLVKGGFGYLWNNNAAVRNALGRPLAAELNAAAFTVQDFPGGVIFYFFDNGDYTFALFNDGTWVGG